MPPRFSVTVHDELPSTSDSAKALAMSGAPHGTVVCALRQTAGRGRLGRPWVSPPGNLHASFVLRYNIAPDRQAEPGFVAALAAADFIDRHLPDDARVRLKWPNDVLVGGAKIAGILSEADGTGPDAWLVLGVGINLLHAPPGMPYPVTSVAAHGGPVPAAKMALDELMEELGTWLGVWERDGFAPVRAAWLRRGPSPGTPIRVTAGSVRHHGEFLDLGADGALVLWTPDGMLRLTSGLVS